MSAIENAWPCAHCRISRIRHHKQKAHTSSRNGELWCNDTSWRADNPESRATYEPMNVIDVLRAASTHNERSEG